MHLKSEKKSNLVKKRRQIKNQPNVGGEMTQKLPTKDPPKRKNSVDSRNRKSIGKTVLNNNAI